jgi:transcriptional regulator with XRE-family HTH domain
MLLIMHRAYNAPMTGPEMKAWRDAAGLTLVEAATMLNGDVTQPTLSRWEQSEKPIPQWASDIFLGATKITLSVAELHALLDYARRNNKSFNAVLADAIRHWLSLQPIKPTCTQPGPQRFTITPPAAANDIRVAEDETPYKA